MNKTRVSEKGQVIVLIVIGLVVLLGFTALAVDGGMVYSDRRHAQNSADAAALAGALQKVNGQPDTEVLNAILDSLNANGYLGEQMSWKVTPYRDWSGDAVLVTVELTATTKTSFAQLLTGGSSIKNRVIAIAKARHSQPVIPGMAIIGMGNCVDGDIDSIIDGNGGGNSGGVSTYLGGIFLNTPEGPDNACAMVAPNNGYGIIAETEIVSVGSYDYNNVDMISPRPITTGINGGVPVDDPLSFLAEPQCTSNGSVINDVNQPGFYGARGQPDFSGGKYAPGIYCISGDVNLAGQQKVTGTGVVLYFMNGGLSFNGNSYIKISAPTVDNCLGTDGDPTASCTYKGIAIFSARNNTSIIQVKGNGSNAVQGMVYALNGVLQARGGGSTPEDAAIIGQAIVRNVITDGGGDVKVTYNAGATFNAPPMLSLMR